MVPALYQSQNQNNPFTRCNLQIEIVWGEGGFQLLLPSPNPELTESQSPICWTLGGGLSFVPQFKTDKILKSHIFLGGRAGFPTFVPEFKTDKISVSFWGRAVVCSKSIDFLPFLIRFAVHRGSDVNHCKISLAELSGTINMYKEMKLYVQKYIKIYCKASDSYLSVLFLFCPGMAQLLPILNVFIQRPIQVVKPVDVTVQFSL